MLATGAQMHAERQFVQVNQERITTRRRCHRRVHPESVGMHPLPELFVRALNKYLLAKIVTPVACS
jgi:hypothetical protein